MMTYHSEINSYSTDFMSDIPFPISSSRSIKKAEQINTESRAARRQEAREQKRKWKVRYKHEASTM